MSLAVLTLRLPPIPVPPQRRPIPNPTLSARWTARSRRRTQTQLPSRRWLGHGSDPWALGRRDRVKRRRIAHHPERGGPPRRRQRVRGRGRTSPRRRKVSASITSWFARAPRSSCCSMERRRKLESACRSRSMAPRLRPPWWSTRRRTPPSSEPCSATQVRSPARYDRDDAAMMWTGTEPVLAMGVFAASSSQVGGRAHGRRSCCGPCRLTLFSQAASWTSGAGFGCHVQNWQVTGSATSYTAGLFLFSF